MARQPEKLTEKDLEQALSLAEVTEIAELGDLAGEVLSELARRIKDPVLRAELPGTGLIQLAKELIKAKRDEPLLESVETSVLQLVRDTNLPDERKKELLTVERERLEDELEMVRNELEEL